MSEQDRGYWSYLLRLWTVKQNGKLIWRASLEEAGSGNKKVFTSLDALCQYLKMDTSVQNHVEDAQ